LKKRGIESPAFKRGALVGSRVNIANAIELYLEFETFVDRKRMVPMRELVRRRGKGEPLQHLLGTVEFRWSGVSCVIAAANGCAS
jgi:release factor glutamine methyltransferase